jgi:hypothetical protein
MATVRTDFRLPLPLLERVDVARGGETRTRFLVRALENQLELEAATGLPTVLDSDVPLVAPVFVADPSFEVEPFPEVVVGTDPEARGFNDRVAVSSSAKAGVVPR